MFFSNCWSSGGYGTIIKIIAKTFIGFGIGIKLRVENRNHNWILVHLKKKKTKTKLEQIAWIFEELKPKVSPKMWEPSNNGSNHLNLETNHYCCKRSLLSLVVFQVSHPSPCLICFSWLKKGLRHRACCSLLLSWNAILHFWVLSFFWLLVLPSCSSLYPFQWISFGL